MNATQRKLRMIRRIQRWADAQSFRDIKVGADTKQKLSVLNKGLLQAIESVSKAQHAVNRLEIAQSRLSRLAKSMQAIAAGKGANLTGKEVSALESDLANAKKENGVDVARAKVNQIKLALKGMKIEK